MIYPLGFVCRFATHTDPDLVNTDYTLSYSDKRDKELIRTEILQKTQEISFRLQNSFGGALELEIS